MTQADARARAIATAAGRLSPPALPAPFLRRERLLRYLDEALGRRLTTIVADAGFGKSTLLASWVADLNCAWYNAAAEDASLASFTRGVSDALRLRVPALAVGHARSAAVTPGPGAELDEPGRARGFTAALCEALQAQLRRDLVLVIDDVHEVEGSPAAAQVIETLCRQAPPELHLVLTSRSELPFPIERLRGQGEVLELSSADLAFDDDEIAELLELVAGGDDQGTATALRRATGGWPAATRLALETIRRVPRDDRLGALGRLAQPRGPLIAYLAEEVFGHERPEVELLVQRVAPLDRFTPALCAELGIPDADAVLRSLARRGLFVELQGTAAGWYTLGAAVREYALTRRPLPESEIATIRREAAAWFRANGEPADALRCLVAADELDAVADLLRTDGAAMLARGAVDAVIDAVGRLDPADRSADDEVLAGEAHRLRGDWEAALRCLERAADTDVVAPALAWRIGLLHHLAGRLDDALAAYARGDEHGEPRDVALLLAWQSAAHWLRGDRDACAADAEHSLALASSANDPQALAAAHTALAMLAALDGDRSANDLHYLRALGYAQEAGDLLQLIRVHANRGSRHIEDSAYEEAIAELDLALRLADLAGYAAFRGLALSNRGEALGRLGRFDEAVADLEAAQEVYRQLGSRMVAYPLTNLGHVYRWRGQSALSRVSYEEAIVQAEAAGDVQGLVPALWGLARVILADDPAEAEQLVARALACGRGLHGVDVLVSAGLVALARGERERASAYAEQGAAQARARHELAGLAESLVLAALAASPPGSALAGVDEAIAVYRHLGNPVGLARAELVRALLAGDAASSRRIEARLRAIGARGYLTTLSVFLPLDARDAIVVQSLGRFRVLREGRPVPLAAWQSRKARDLFKILVARRGRPVPRDALMEALWPGQGAAPLGNRLSVLLSTVRAVLDPDKRHAADRFVGADRAAVWLVPEHVSVDVEEFLVAADTALALRREGHAAAAGRLVAAEASYTGDFLEEDAYEEWAIGIREECRAAYTEVVRALAEDAHQRHDTDAATRFYLRILERDPYDESAHLGLVATLEAAGRHGEARRCFRTYSTRMDSIGVESAPFPVVQRRDGATSLRRSKTT